MRKTHLILSLLLIISLQLYGKEYFVSPNGSDQNSGTIKSPFYTIQKAVDIMNAGDVCTVREGVYKEVVIIRQGGRSGRPLRIQAYPGEIVTLSGLESVTGDWSVHKGSIYKASVDHEFDQIFVDKEMMIEARWPNMKFEEKYDRSKWASSDVGSRYGKMKDAEMAKTGIDFTGALATLNVAHQFHSWTRKVNTHTPGSDTFTYDRDLYWIRHDPQRFSVWEDDKYYLSGILEALDAPTEWYLDNEDKTLYLRTLKSDNPAKHKVEAKMRNYAFDVSNCGYVELVGLHFFATTFRFIDCYYCIVDNCHLLYPTYSKEIPETYEIPQPGVMTQMKGRNNIIRNCSLAFSAMGGFYMQGPYSKAENNLVRDINWSGTLSYTGIRIQPGERATNAQAPIPKTGGCIARRNTVFNTGYSSIAFRGPKTIVEYNHTYNAGMLSKDVQCIGTSAPDAVGSVIRYNWIHDVFAPHIALGIRGDDQTRGLTMHHNVIWNIGREGIIMKGDDNTVCNNTVFRTHLLSDHADIRIDAKPEPLKTFRWQYPLLNLQNVNTKVFNNYASRIWGARNAETPPGGLIANNCHANDPKLVDPDHFDFRPRKGSPLIDQGRIIPGITASYHGYAPDCGAYEYGGVKWTAGYINKIVALETKVDLKKGQKATLNVFLFMPPIEPVSVNVYSKNGSVKVLKGATLQFTPDNWMMSQKVILSATESSHLYFSGQGLQDYQVVVNVKK